MPFVFFVVRIVQQHLTRGLSENAITRHADGLVLVAGNPCDIKRKGGRSVYAKVGKKTGAKELTLF